MDSQYWAKARPNNAATHHIFVNILYSQDFFLLTLKAMSSFCDEWREMPFQLFDVFCLFQVFPKINPNINSGLKYPKVQYTTKVSMISKITTKSIVSMISMISMIFKIFTIKSDKEKKIPKSPSRVSWEYPQLWLWSLQKQTEEPSKYVTFPNKV